MARLQSDEDQVGRRAFPACAPRKGPYTKKVLFSLPFLSCLLLEIFRYCDRICYCHWKVPGPCAQPSEGSTRPQEVPDASWCPGRGQSRRCRPVRQENQFFPVSTAAHRLAAGNKRTPSSFNAVILFQRKKQNKNNLCIWGEGIVFTHLEKDEEQSYGEVSYQNINLHSMVAVNPQLNTDNAGRVRGCRGARLSVINV